MGEPSKVRWLDALFRAVKEERVTSTSDGSMVSPTDTRGKSKTTSTIDG